MSDGPPFDDRLPDGEFDAKQHAMHGLLGRYFSDDPSGENLRADAIIRRWRAVCQPAPAATGELDPTPVPSGDVTLRVRWGRRARSFLSKRSRRWAVGGTGLAAAAAVVIAAFVWTTPAVRADLLADAVNSANAFFDFLQSAGGLFSDDPAMAAAYRRAVEDSRRKRDAGRAAIDSQATLPEAEIMEFLFAWQNLYCALRNLGDMQAAVAENDGAFAYARARRSDRRYKMWEQIYLDGLGNTFAAAGDYAGARDAYLKTLDARRHTPVDRADPHIGEPGYEGHLLQQIMPVYLRLTMLSIAEGRLDEARTWWTQAHRLNLQFFRTVCEMNDISLPASASLWEVWLAIPAQFRSPRSEYTAAEIAAWPQPWKVYGPYDSSLHWLGALLYHDAVVSRLEGNLAAAKAALDRAATLEDAATRCPANDEYRVPFLLHQERARVAIIENDFDHALSELDRADAYVAAIRRFFESPEADRAKVPDVSRLPISPSRRAEQRLLRGLALLGSDPKSTEGRKLVEAALSVPQKLAAAMPPAERDRFLNQFAAWQDLATGAYPPRRAAPDTQPREARP